MEKWPRMNHHRIALNIIFFFFVCCNFFPQQISHYHSYAYGMDRPFYRGHVKFSFWTAQNKIKKMPKNEKTSMLSRLIDEATRYTTLALMCKNERNNEKSATTVTDVTIKFVFCSPFFFRRFIFPSNGIAVWWNVCDESPFAVLVMFRVRNHMYICYQLIHAFMETEW